MKLRITQCHVGNFNLIGNEKTLSFYMSILNDDGKTVEANGVKAVLHYSGEPEEYDEFKEALDNLEYVFDKCYKYANRIISSTDYKAQCIAFAKVYNDHYMAFDEQLVRERKDSIKKKIADLEIQLKIDSILPSLQDTFEVCVAEQIQGIKKRIGIYDKEMEQLKEESPRFIECAKIKGELLAKIEKLKLETGVLTNG